MAKQKATAEEAGLNEIIAANLQKIKF